MESIKDLLERIEKLEKAVFGLDTPTEIKTPEKDFSKFIDEIKSSMQKLHHDFPDDDRVIFQAVIHNKEGSANYHVTSLETLEKEERDEELASICTILSSTQRISILRHLSKGELSSGELVEKTKMAGGHLHHHLRELQSKNFIKKTDHGKYEASEDGLNAYLTIAALNRRLTYNHRTK